MEPRGILRNRAEGSPTDQAETAELDRQEVIRNTRLNAQLASESSEGEKIRAKIAQEKASGEPTHEHLKWDEINLYKTEQEKAATMKIDEPKTPYEGGFDPTGEYYRDDDGDDAPNEDIPDFSLGEGLYETDGVKSQSLNGGEVIPGEEEDAEEEKEEEKPLLAEERHQRFEEMRKKHYHNAALPLKHSDSEL